MAAAERSVGSVAGMSSAALRDAYREIWTKRLILRRPQSSDATEVFTAFASDPEVTRFLRWRPHQTLADAHLAMATRLQRLEAGEEYSWLLSPRDEGSVLGIISAWPGDRGVEIGFALGRRFWGRGLMTEAVHAVVSWALDAPKVNRVWATCDAENLASGRVLEKAGLHREGVLNAHEIHPNVGPYRRDCVLYAKTRSAT